MDMDIYTAEKDTLLTYLAEMTEGSHKYDSSVTFYFYLRSMDGDGDDIYSDDSGGGCVTIYDVDERERGIFDFDRYITAYIVEEDSQGFVYGNPLTAKGEERERDHAAELYEEEEGS